MNKFSYVTKGDKIHEFTSIQKSNCEWRTAFESFLLWSYVFLSNVNECISSYCEKFPGNKNWENIMQYLASIKLDEYSKCVELQILCSQFISNMMNKNEIFIWVYTHMCIYMCTQFLKYLWNESIENRSPINLKNISPLVFMFLKEQIVRSFFRNKKKLLLLNSFIVISILNALLKLVHYNGNLSDKQKLVNPWLGQVSWRRNIMVNEEYTHQVRVPAGIYNVLN